MRLSILIASAFALLAPCVTALSLQGRLLLEAPLPPDTTVVLDGGVWGSSLVDKDGSFYLDNLHPGEYILTVPNRVFSFPPLHVTLEESSLPKCRPYRLTYPLSQSAPILPYPLFIRPSARLVYHDPKLPFDLWRLIAGNPMILLMGGSLLLMFFLPKMMASLDPEALAEIQKNHAQMTAMQNMDFGSGISQLLAGPQQQQDSSSKSSSSSSNSSSNKKRR